MRAVGAINAHMIGTPAEPGEHVDWGRPDIMSEVEWRELLGCSVEEYAEGAPHMILFEAGEIVAAEDIQPGDVLPTDDVVVSGPHRPAVGDFVSYVVQSTNRVISIRSFDLGYRVRVQR